MKPNEVLQYSHSSSSELLHVSHRKQKKLVRSLWNFDYETNIYSKADTVPDIDRI